MMETQQKNEELSKSIKEKDKIIEEFHTKFNNEVKANLSLRCDTKRYSEENEALKVEKKKISDQNIDLLLENKRFLD